MSEEPIFDNEILGFEDVTNGIRVAAQSYFLEHQSSPRDGLYIWAYQIEITNERDTPVQLLNRHWIITDANAHIDEVKGAGVVGLQPVLRPGQCHRYTSGSPLKTPAGFMRGQFEMVCLVSEKHFMVDIPAFLLDSPYNQQALH